MRLFDGSEGGEGPQHWTHWSRHYELYERDLSKTAYAPYVAKLKGLPSPTPIPPPPRPAATPTGGAGEEAQPFSFGRSVLQSMEACAAIPRPSWGQEQRLQEASMEAPSGGSSTAPAALVPIFPI